MENFTRLRSVGKLEQYSTARHQIGFYTNVAVTATYVLPESYDRPIKDYVFRACASLIGEHPVLSAIPVADDTQEPYFVRLPQIDLDQVVEFTQRSTSPPNTAPPSHEPAPDQDLQALLQAQHNTPFAAPRAYWRLCVLCNPENDKLFTASFVFHHALGDGNSGKAFHRTFLKALSGTPSSGGSTSIIASPQTPLLPNIEAIHPMPLSFFYLAKKIFQAKVWSPSAPGLWAGSPIRTPLKTRIRLVSLPAGLLISLRDLCRQEQTTITALLQTVVARSLFVHLPDHFYRLNSTGAISARRWLPDFITDDSMGVFVEGVEDSYLRSDVMTSVGTFPWDEARRSRRTIEAELKLEGKDTSINLLKYVNDFQQELCVSKVGQPRDKSFEVSNLGFVPSAMDPEQPSIQGMVFSQCGSVIGNAIMVSAVTGGDGCLNLAVSWQEASVDEQLVDAFIRSAADELRRLAE
ncbi:hypothetical protein N7492_003309 [Penicillium capsulatum]|uniref:Alcohol acetyltransferase n=1 Tax=Penicillium capsulatum TaxID=69766 RepID=A0A9W9LWU3_9EURO|nr:hypothetical protein N7492_003309 [Penicillium capsulatum]KAJ6122108.1 hypothetical protein N7512_004573 [Penicillium capsulatum]